MYLRLRMKIQMQALKKKMAAENIQKILDRDDKKDDKIREDNNKLLKNVGGVFLLALGISMATLGVKISFKPPEISDNDV